MNKILNCPNCGAPIEGSKCPYCGSVIFDFLNLDLDNAAPTYVRMRFGGRIHIFKARPTSFDIHQDYEDTMLYADNRVVYRASYPELTLNLEMQLEFDDKLGKAYGAEGKTMAVIIDPEKFEGRF